MVATDAGADAAATLHDLWALARSYARDDIACQSDLDCCGVVDLCQNNVYVVAANDQATVAGIIEDAYQVWTQNQNVQYAPADVCNVCVPPTVVVACSSSGFCTGSKATCMPTQDQCRRVVDGGACPTGIQSVEPSPPGKKPLTVLGCTT